MHQFVKYQGTGNDFILIDNRSLSFDAFDKIPSLCDRKYGIGSDGIILIQSHADPDFDFEMVFFNPDGSTSFCGNGSRCAVAYAKELGIIATNATFVAFDGLHKANIKNGNVTVKMADCDPPKLVESGKYIDTGSPHFIQVKEDIKSLDVNMLGRNLRFRTDLFGDAGTNVNFIAEKEKGSIFVRTYERGVEAETLSCGTGVTAAAICYGLEENISHVHVETLGGKLSVNFDGSGTPIKNIYLSGPFTKVFEGSIQI